MAKSQLPMLVGKVKYTSFKAITESLIWDLLKEKNVNEQEKYWDGTKRCNRAKVFIGTFHVDRKKKHHILNMNRNLPKALTAIIKKHISTDLD